MSKIEKIILINQSKEVNFDIKKKYGRYSILAKSGKEKIYLTTNQALKEIKEGLQKNTIDPEIAKYLMENVIKEIIKESSKDKSFLHKTRSRAGSYFFDRQKALNDIDALIKIGMNAPFDKPSIKPAGTAPAPRLVQKEKEFSKLHQKLEAKFLDTTDEKDVQELQKITGEFLKLPDIASPKNEKTRASQVAAKRAYDFASQYDLVIAELKTNPYSIDKLIQDINHLLKTEVPHVVFEMNEMNTGPRFTKEAKNLFNLARSWQSSIDIALVLASEKKHLCDYLKKIREALSGLIQQEKELRDLSKELKTDIKNIHSENELKHPQHPLIKQALENKPVKEMPVPEKAPAPQKVDRVPLSRTSTRKRQENNTPEAEAAKYDKQFKNEQLLIERRLGAPKRSVRIRKTPPSES